MKKLQNIRKLFETASDRKRSWSAERVEILKEAFLYGFLYVTVYSRI